MTSVGPAESSVADCLLGRYELLMPVATGGMAVVWAARLKGTRGFTKIVAVKTMRPELSEDPQFEHMLFDEASLASRVRHPHVVEILDLGDEKGIPYIVMEWIDGEPIHTIMKAAAAAGQGIPLPISTRIILQACAGLHAAHELRDDAGKLVELVHRDVSPQNILVTWDGVAKVVDFGVAKAIGRASEETRAGQVKGKVNWLAPEQAKGGTVDRRSDVFSLGLLLYVMTTGKHPFRGSSEFKTLSALCSADPPVRPGKLVPGYPPQLEKVLMQALEKDPAKRFQTAADMLRMLDHALPGNKRISTDEEVAEFLRPLLATRYEHRRKQLKEAQRIADERTMGAGSRASFTTEVVGLMIDHGPGSALSPVSGIQAVGQKESTQDNVTGGGMTTTERAAAARTVAGIVQRLKAGQPSATEVVIKGVPAVILTDPAPVEAPQPPVPEPPLAVVVAPVPAPAASVAAASAPEAPTPAAGAPSPPEAPQPAEAAAAASGAAAEPLTRRGRALPAALPLARAIVGRTWFLATAGVLLVVGAGFFGAWLRTVSSRPPARPAASAPETPTSAIPPGPLAVPLLLQDAGVASASEQPAASAVEVDAPVPEAGRPEAGRPEAGAPADAAAGAKLKTPKAPYIPRGI